MGIGSLDQIARFVLATGREQKWQQQEKRSDTSCLGGSEIFFHLLE